MLSALDGAFGDRPDAMRVGDEACSWEELARRAGALDLAGASILAVTATASLDTIIAVVAGLRSGVTVVPIPPDSGPDEREHILRDSGADLELVDGRLEARAGGGATDAALLLYTSGTTGAPKGVQLSAAALAADLDALAEAWAWTPDDLLVHGLPLFHVHGLVLGMLGPLRLGSRVHHTVRPTPRAYAAAGATMAFGVPTVWSRIAADPDAARALADLRLLVSGSAPLPVPVFEALRSLTGHDVVERYGMTETLITVSARSDGPRRAGHVGTALAGIGTRLRSEDEQVVAQDGTTIGELQVSGPTLFSGYLGRPDATAAAMTEDGWFRTGDIATIDPGGGHRIVGRASIDLIKTGGYRVGAGEVEDALLSHAAVAEAAVVGAPHDDLGQEIVAFVVADGVTPEELVQHVASRLSVHKRPRRVVLVDALPRNAMGKVQKKLLQP